MKVAKLTTDHIPYIRKYLGDSDWNTHCNPIQDIDNNWIISLIEAQYIPKEHYIEIEYKPKPQEE